MPPPPPCEQSLLLSSWGEEGLCLNSVRPFESPHAQILSSNWFFKCEHSFIDKTKVITEPVVPSARLLGLGSNLYLSNMQRCTPKSSQRKKGSAGRKETASSPVDLFNPRSDQNQYTPNNIGTLSKEKVMRINKMITKGEISVRPLLVLFLKTNVKDWR